MVGVFRILSIAVHVRLHDSGRIQTLFPHLDAMQGMKHGDPPSFGLLGTSLVDPKNVGWGEFFENCEIRIDGWDERLVVFRRRATMMFVCLG